MARTPLFNVLRRSATAARVSARSGAPPLDELLQRESPRMTRRTFSKLMGAGAAAVGLWTAAGCRIPSSSRPRVAIVGAGMAGLTTGWYLRQAGIRADIYEASNRVGGRMYTARGLMGEGTWTELGGEFIDSGHDAMWDLIDHFGLDTIDMESDDERGFADAYFFGGRRYSGREVAEAFAPLALKIAADFEALGDEISYHNPGTARALDELSLDQYLDRIGASGWIRDLLEVAYVGEYGLDASEQSALNLIALISTDVSDGELALFGDSDERYKIVGGNQTLPERLAADLAGQIETGTRLEALRLRAGRPVVTLSRAGSSTFDRRADVVILTIPFTMLRRVDVDADISPAKQAAVAELGYGTNAKIFFGVEERIWRARNESGSVYSDAGFQLAWDHTRAQPGPHGGMTIYLGGAEGVAAGDGEPEQPVERYAAGLDEAHPGLASVRNARTARFHWPSHPYTLGSYSCYRPGQWTGFGGAEGEPEGPILFAGEHCSPEYQGFMNGAAETGRQAAEAVLAVAGTPVEAVSH